MNNRDFETRVNPLVKKINFIDPKINEQINNDIYLATYIFPKILATRTPAQIKYNNCFLTIYNNIDIDFLLKTNSFRQLKIRRMFRFIEEANEQNYCLSYKELAFLLNTTKNSIYNYISEFKYMYNIDLFNHRAPFITRKTFLIKYIFLNDMYLNKLSYDMKLIKNMTDIYSTREEYFGVVIEFLITCLAQYSNTANELTRKMHISEIQAKQYLELFKKNFNDIKRFHKLLFVNGTKYSDICRLLIYTVLQFRDFYFTDDIENYISQQIELFSCQNLYYNNFSLNNNCIAYKLRNKDETKFKQVNDNVLKEVSLNIFNQELFNNFNCKSTKIIGHKIHHLREDALKKYDCRITEMDICFLLAISRDVYSNHCPNTLPRVKLDY